MTNFNFECITYCYRVLSSPLMDPNSNEYLTNPANIYIRNSKPPENTILIDLKNQKNHMFRYITCSKNVSPRDRVQSS